MIFFDRGIESTISFIGIYILKGAPERYYLSTTNRFNVVNFRFKKREREKRNIIFSNNKFIPPSKL